MYKANKYTKCYYSIVDRARNRTLSGYSERHHIIPRSLGGTDDDSNLVNLTAREHFICHLLLVKMVSRAEDIGKMATAATWFRRHDGLVNNRTYESLKTQVAEYKRALYTGRKLGPRPHAAITQKAVWDSLSPEQRAARTANYGAPLSEETKAKIGAANAAKWVQKKASGDMPVVDDAYRAKKRAAAQARWAKPPVIPE